MSKLKDCERGSPGLAFEPKSRPLISALKEEASMLRLLYALGVLVRLSTLSILALPSKDRGVAVALLVRSTSAHGAEILTHCLARHILHTAAAP